MRFSVPTYHIEAVFTDGMVLRSKRQPSRPTASDITQVRRLPGIVAAVIVAFRAEVSDGPH